MGRARRQWGADRRTEPLPPVAAAPSARSLTANRLAIVVTVLAWLGYVIAIVIREFVSNGVQNFRFAAEAVTYLVIVTALTGSALAYLLTRLGYLYRVRAHRRVPRAEIDAWFAGSMPTLTVLVPAYREDQRVIRQTLLSAALQEYPYLRVVLLVDDPPDPTRREHLDALARARRVPTMIAELLAEPRGWSQSALETFEHRAGDRELVIGEELRDLAAAYHRAVDWLRELARREARLDHSDDFFVDHVVLRLAADLALVADAVDHAAREGATLPTDRVLELYRRLAWTFRAELSSFERKSFASLSNEPNKAMNLNSYIGLMGGSYRIVDTPDGRVLEPAPRGLADLDVPDPDYVLTLDADSVLLPEYCLRLVHLLEQPENARVAVAQTPYSAFPGSATRIERLSGATTDLQHISHQGMTHYGATFWVGANAVLRKRALDDISETEIDGRRVVHRYIQDRTVIEDTESSIDLAVHGWTLYNYPERLSYSATPPDFGSLCIQRQRWANGGLLILRKLWVHFANERRRGERGRLGELFIRMNYMASICWSSFGLLLLLAYPYSQRLLSPLVVLAALPYFAAMASDLRRCGYRRSDVLRIYGYNLVLLPVNISGVCKSLGQAITGSKIAFARTPKVRDRTTAAASFVLVPYVLVALSVYTLVRDLQRDNWGHAIFAGVNASLASYAIVAFIGVRNSAVDVALGVVNRLYRSEKPVRYRVRPRATPPAATPVADWSTVLYWGQAAAPPATGPQSAGTAHRPPPRRVPTHVGPTMTVDSPARVEHPTARDEVHDVLAQCLREMRDDTRVVLRLDGPTVTVSIERDR